MCGVDGMVLDDGVVMRLAEDRFLLTTTTGNAAAVLDWMQRWLQTEWPELRASLTSVTEHWATIALVGPESRDVLAAVTTDFDVSNGSFPFMTWQETSVAGRSARVCRVTFSGELAYEINVNAWDALPAWQALMDAGHQYGITAYGTQTMHVLRAEKGYPIIGQDTDGTVTPQDLGMSWVISKSKADFIGKRSHRRPENLRADRRQLVGLLPIDPEQRLVEGAHVLADESLPAAPVTSLGHVTSAYRSAAMNRTFGLALVAAAASASARSSTPGTEARPCPSGLRPVLYDKAGDDVTVDNSLRSAHSQDGNHVRRTTSVDSDHRRSIPDPAQPAGGPGLRRRRPLLRTFSAGRCRRRRVAPCHMAISKSCGSALTSGWSSRAWATSTARGATAQRCADGWCAITDVSAQRTAITIAGDGAEEVLLQGCSIDLHPSVSPAGACFQTLLAQAGVILVVRRPLVDYRILVRASFAAYLAAWLVDAARA